MDNAIETCILEVNGKSYDGFFEFVDGSIAVDEQPEINEVEIKE